MCEPAEVGRGVLDALADDRHVEAAADDAGDVPERHALLGHAVIAGPRGALLEREPEELRSIEAVNCGPAVEAVAHVSGSLPVPRHSDEQRHKAMIAIAMDRWRQAHHRDAH